MFQFLQNGNAEIDLPQEIGLCELLIYILIAQGGTKEGYVRKVKSN